MKLVLIRHGEAVGNREQRLLGRSDPDLTEQGIAQAQALHTYFSNYFPAPTQIFTSPLHRARQTAAVLGSVAQALPMHVCEDLTEIDLGILTGLTWPEAQDRYPSLTQQLESQLEWLPIPAAESPAQAYHRAQRLWQKLCLEASNPDQVWIVSHAGFLQYLLSVILGMERVWQITIAPTAWFELDIQLPYLTQAETSEERYNPVRWQIQQFNVTPHLSHA